jgi:hypothetical protein
MAIHFFSEQLDHARRALQAIPGGVERAAVPAMNRAALAAKTFGIRKLTGTYATRRANVGRTVRMERATRGSLVAGFSSSGNRLPLTSFQVRPGGRSTKSNELSVTVRKDSGGAGIKRGFVNALKSGRLAVLQREGSARYPIRALFGPAVPQMFNEAGVREEVEGRGMEMLTKRFDHEIGRLLSRGAR